MTQDRATHKAPELLAMQELLSPSSLDVDEGFDESDMESVALTVVAKHMTDAVLFCGTDGRIQWANQGFERLTGYTLAEIYGKTLGSIGQSLDGSQMDDFRQRMWAGESYSSDTLSFRKDGSAHWINLNIHPIRTRSSGQFGGFVAVARDASTCAECQANVRNLQYIDTVSQLPNRAWLAKQVDVELRRSEESGQSFCVVLIDLDNFKNINETLGHRVGDELVSHMAQRLNAQSRVQDTYARVGGDEFMVLLPNVHRTHARNLVNQMLEAICEPISLAELDYTVTASVGMAFYPDHGQNFDTLYKNADIAMYKAKRDGKNSIRVFDPCFTVSTVRSVSLESDLRKALDREELTLFYQPQVSLADCSVSGVEALLRWQHPTFGWIPPNEFVSMAEQSGFIVRLGDWVLRTAAKQMREWVVAGLMNTRVAVNLSAVQLRQREFADRLIQMLADVGLPPRHLECELTETAALVDPEVATTVFRHMQRAGITVSIDDFGTGYSSLSYLTRFHPDKVKIDQSFIEHLDKSVEHDAIVGAIIDMCRNLGHTTIAEGVRNMDQFMRLRERGCDGAQGFYLAKPMPANEIPTWLKRWSREHHKLAQHGCPQSIATHQLMKSRVGGAIG